MKTSGHTKLLVLFICNYVHTFPLIFNQATGTAVIIRPTFMAEIKVTGTTVYTLPLQVTQILQL